MDSRLSDASHSMGSHRKAKFGNMYSKILLVRYGTHNLTSCKFVGRSVYYYHQGSEHEIKRTENSYTYFGFGCGLSDQIFGFVKRSIIFLNRCVRHYHDLKLVR